MIFCGLLACSSRTQTFKNSEGKIFVDAVWQWICSTSDSFHLNKSARVFVPPGTIMCLCDCSYLRICSYPASCPFPSTQKIQFCFISIMKTMKTNWNEETVELWSQTKQQITWRSSWRLPRAVLFNANFTCECETLVSGLFTCCCLSSTTRKRKR